jgi:hypothetical protein
MISGNKGEWSEFWVFAKCALDAEIPLCDENLKPFTSQKLTLTKIYIGEETLTINDPGEIILLVQDGTKTIIQKAAVRKALHLFLNELLDAKGSSFSLRNGQYLLDHFQHKALKSPSSVKKDITLGILDPKTYAENIAGFSIKSQLGGASTLLNASKENTNFVFEIVNFTGDLTGINKINSQRAVVDRIHYILSCGGSFKFIRCNGKTFTQNLMKIDSQMPELVGYATLSNFIFQENNKGLAEVLNSDCFQNYCSTLCIPLSPDIIKYKFKNFLLNIALGMIPKTPWEGIPNADGGYIIVKKDGSIVCFHIFNFGAFQNYLFKQVKFDTPSSSRHNFGEAYSEDRRLFFNVNCQIRFKA